MDHKDVQPPMPAVLSDNRRAYLGCPAGTPISVLRSGPFGAFFVRYENGRQMLMHAAEFNPVSAAEQADGNQQGT